VVNQDKGGVRDVGDSSDIVSDGDQVGGDADDGQGSVGAGGQIGVGVGVRGGGTGDRGFKDGSVPAGDSADMDAGQQG